MMIVWCWMWLNKLGWLMQLGRCVETLLIPRLPGGSRLCKQVLQCERAQLRCMIDKNSPRTFSTHIYTHTHMISRTHLHTGRDAVTEMNKSTFAHTHKHTHVHKSACAITYTRDYTQTNMRTHHCATWTKSNQPANILFISETHPCTIRNPTCTQWKCSTRDMRSRHL